MQFTANQIATLVNGTVEGNGNASVSTFAKIEEGVPGAISFLANPKYTPYIYETDSSIVLVSNDFEPEKPVKPTLIRVADPYATVAMLLKMVEQMTTHQPQGIEQPSFIASTVTVPEKVYIGAFAYIGENVKLSQGVKIYPQAYIGHNVEIGEDTIIYPGVKIYHGCRIGARCIIHAGAVIGADGFGFAPENGHYSKIPQLGIVEIGNDVEIGANTTVDRATMGCTRIADGVKLDNLIQVAHNCEIGNDTVMASQCGVAGSTKIGAHCMMGGQVGIAGHITVGDNVSVGAQTGIAGTVKSNARIMGSPAIDAREWTRQVVYTKNLPSLYDRVKQIENELKK
ncbi:MAG: UDP-3-O-(3-hydroxymyristoyl)glucosamine N-acyltransferase [Muribaculaceae bacterium]|nr:UDP-3-O-(3-hydroxymyristoyl)glucosamine N-acyltransferase [Muribaculaceae bacterium]